MEYKREVYPYFGNVLWEAQEIQYEWRQSMELVLAYLSGMTQAKIMDHVCRSYVYVYIHLWFSIAHIISHFTTRVHIISLHKKNCDKCEVNCVNNKKEKERKEKIEKEW